MNFYQFIDNILNGFDPSNVSYATLLQIEQSLYYEVSKAYPLLEPKGIHIIILPPEGLFYKLKAKFDKSVEEDLIKFYPEKLI